MIMVVVVVVVMMIMMMMMMMAMPHSSEQLKEEEMEIQWNDVGNLLYSRRYRRRNTKGNVYVAVTMTKSL